MAEITPQPLFILSPPRSFSSVVCSILGQHPQCYGLPELHMFFADDLGGVMKGTFRGAMVVDGLLRTLAQLHDGEQTESSIVRARQWAIGRSSWPIRKVFDHIQELVGPRVLVEKSPATTYTRESVSRLVRNFPKANLLHLIRHPRSTGESLVTLRSQFKGLDLITRGRPKLDPERIWRVSHTMAVTVTADLPVGQCMRLKGEALLPNLDVYLPQICEWLEIRTDDEAIESMMHPEKSPYAKLGPRGARFGNDPSFLEAPVLDHKRLAKLKEPRLDGELSWRPGETFAPATRRLAKQFGYQ
jgi:Sulfotransferase family